MKHRRTHFLFQPTFSSSKTVATISLFYLPALQLQRGRVQEGGGNTFTNYWSGFGKNGTTVILLALSDIEVCQSVMA